MGILKADRDYFLNAIPKGSGALLDIGGGGGSAVQSLFGTEGVYIR